MNLPQLFDLSLQGRRQRVGLEFGGRTYTFGEIEERSNQMAALFAARGLERGDRLCVYLANCVELIDIYLACVKLGVIFVPMNILYRDREIAHILADAEPKAVVAAQEMPGSTPVWRVMNSGDRRRLRGRRWRSMATRRPLWSTRRGLPAYRKGRSLPTITLRPTA